MKSITSPGTVVRLCVVEMHNLWQALEVAVVAVRFDKVRARPLVHVAERGRLERAVDEQVIALAIAAGACVA